MSGLAGSALVLATPAATWWLIGDQSTVPPDADPQYAIRPLPIASDVTRLIGIGSVVLAVAALSWLVRESWRRRLDTSWWSVLLPLAGAGALTGGGWRVVTAGVYGANIGAGLVVLFGSPIVAALLICSLARSIVLLARSRRRKVVT